MHRRAASGRRSCRGFTLIELLVALAVMALLALMSWQGLDGMARTQQATQARADDLLALQAGLGQWRADLDASTALPGRPAIDWDGRVLRLLRRSAGGSNEGLRVVAWAQRSLTGTDEDARSGPHWLRWQSPPLRTRGELDLAWQRASLWGHNPGADDLALEVPIVPLDDWQVLYFRGDSWTHPLSSTGNAPSTPQATAMPDGVRLVLTLAPPHALAGKITSDWARPTFNTLRN